MFLRKHIVTLIRTDVEFPKVLITDADQALANAIETCLSACRNLLCQWNIDNNVMTHVKKHIPRKEKFVSAWTDRYIQLGNKIISSVEGAHSKHKRYLQTSKGIFRVFFNTYPI
ncbi:hypothetical protein PsorP6_001806 [Peronosclerospora sorghi]|uniref:Uncharacterized protein n=1 Tax=Peronosclerospora sorghi TaxID=230839 RepID=A0ACC0WRW5_9STRA|nr:hypothetical protein PsorP6_001806 [Peronosclerospora sorghi]